MDRNQLRAELYPRIAVALLAEGVDRNRWAIAYSVLIQKSPSSRRAWIEIFLELEPEPRRNVALLAEGVDRNVKNPGAALPTLVALLAEGVDRNNSLQNDIETLRPSPSSRRAWIEIVTAARSWRPSWPSPSSRRAWIEI